METQRHGGGTWGGKAGRAGVTSESEGASSSRGCTKYLFPIFFERWKGGGRESPVKDAHEPH